MIVERDEILAAISTRLAAARQGRGSVILLGGEAGAGKSAVVRTAIAQARTAATVVEGACDPLTTPRPLGPIVEILDDPRLQLAESQSDHPSATTLSSALLEALSARRTPSLVIVEDLHWADEGTLDVVRYVGRRIAATGSVMLATYRDDETVGDHPLVPVVGQLRRLDSTIHLAVRPLTREGVQTLVAAADIDLDAAAVHARTGGNAFYVSELLAADRSDLDAVPGNVQAAVTARIARLDADVRHLVEATAIAPGFLEYDHAVSLAGADEETVDRAIAAGILVLTTGRLAFRHELARLAVLDATPAGRRERYHRELLDRLTAGAADALDTARIAHHAVAVGDEARVLQFAVAAAGEAEQIGANRQAVEFLTHALRFSAEADARAVTSWRTRRGSLLRQRGALTEATADLEQAASEYRGRSDLVGLVGALRSLSSANRDAGNRAEADRLAREALSAAEASGDRLAHARALVHAAFLAMLSRRGGAAIEMARRGLDIAVECNDRAATIDAEHGLACALLIGGMEDEAIRRLSELHDRAGASGEPSRQVWIGVNLGSGSGETRRYDVAREWLRRSEERARQADMDHAAAYSAAWLARVACETGRWEDVAAHVRRAVDGPAAWTDLSTVPPDVGDSFVTVTALGALGRTRVRRGDPGGGELLRRALEAGQDHDVQYRWPVGCALAEHALWQREPEVGLQILAPIHRQAMATDSAWARGETAYWMWRLGGLDEPPPDGAAEPFTLSWSGRWQSAADAWEALGCPYEQALSLLDSGREEPISHAIDILDGLGARPAAQQARQRLRELGHATVPAMPRRSTIGNPGSLTNRQLDVLRLMVEGASNGEIARRLFVSKKTVEHHVSAVFAKLGVSDRPAAMVRGRHLLDEPGDTGPPG